MTTVTPIATGIDGAIGSEYSAAENALYFVEYDGALSRYEFSPDGATTVSSGTATLRGTYLFDFDAGAEQKGSADVWWNQQTDTERQLEPRNGAEIAALGSASFGGLSAAEVAAAPFGTDPIEGNADGQNDLAEGDVFAVRTSEDNVAKVVVRDYGYDLEVEWRTYELPEAYAQLGTGYDRPEDVALAADGVHAYVTERGGDLLRVDLSNADRSAATVVASGLTRPHQIVLDEPRRQAHLVEFDASGRLLRVDLSNGDVTAVRTGLENAVGLAMADDGATAYVTEQASAGGRLRRLSLGNGGSDVVVDDLDAPFFLTWADETEERLFVTERDPQDRISAIDLTAGERYTVADDTPVRPSSVAVAGPNGLAVCTGDVLGTLALPGEDYDAGGPLFLGVGRVPVSYVTSGHSDPDKNGYADTTGGDGDFVVRDAPFGGTIPIMLNHERAFDEGYRYYRLTVDGDEPRQSWDDYKWSSSTNRFEPRTISAASGGYYPVRSPDELWYDHWLGYELNTRGVEDGLRTVEIEFYTDRNRSSAGASASVDLRIDNNRPRAQIHEIVHQHATDGPTPVGECGIVEDGGDAFTFDVTADDPEGHLKSIRLSSRYGTDGRQVIKNETYADNAGSAPAWTGYTATEIPTGGNWTATDEDDERSTRCARVFDLVTWGRTIDGRRHIHRSHDWETMTLLLD